MPDQQHFSQEQLDDLLREGSPLEDAIIDALEFELDALEELSATNVRFINCRWVEADFSAARFVDCQFAGCSFSRGQLGDVTFVRCNFFDSGEGDGTDFTYAEMREAAFENCNLSSSRFVGADMFDVSIKDSKANGADFDQATFTRTYGRAQRVTRATMTSTIFDDANMAGLDLENCNLAKSSFVRADLSSTIFVEADMSECDLAGAQLRRSNFDRTDLRGAQLEGMSLGLLSGYDGMKISEDQQSSILAHLGIQVYP
ncbi:pentapeptide repeat-containing protein [Maritalea porphyrae]|uniref:Pentapeptide repeat-containing protein n=1 Tax=Maritalea porphyrae TaxID=880732 RepID=A0ABQ5ULC3_9HYPH|nr:pentapeptide repeat-containing protein [Maritalea porphyrae]GLQ15841.1 hypothetical protein GCM10007879_00900 [Maritalea porphyrae]